ncbi:MAG: branched-chain amino acid ABC transporter permease [Clostridia bacterium]|nr:branched-chain amino acid ABC transporter permease [Clostridia bacterium]
MNTNPTLAPEKRRIKPKHYINYVLVLLLLIPFALSALTGSVKFSTSDLVVKIAYSMILAVSLNLVVGFLGELSLGHAGFMCVGAYVGGLFANTLSKSVDSKLLVFFISMVVGGLLAALFGFLIGLPTLRLKGDYLAIVTLAFGEIVRTVFRNQEIFGGAMGLSTNAYQLKELYIPAIVALVMVLVTVFATQNLMRSKHGRAIQAIRDNEIAARAMGVNVTYYKLVVFVIAAFFAGVAGVIYSQSNSLVTNSFFSFNYSIEILVMVVLGGMGNISGSLIAAAILTFINVKLTTQLSGDLAALKFLIYALILILMVMWNNAPKLAGLRERINMRNLVLWIKKTVFRLTHKTPEGGEEPPTNAAWDKIPTKIEMDAILSTDVKPDRSFEADKPQKPKGEK